jgi:prolyl-tRNA synthetase
MMGGKIAHEYMTLTPIGEDTLILCGACGYAANRQIAKVSRRQPEPAGLLAVQKVATPDSKSIADLAAFLHIREDQTAKAVFMMATVLDGVKPRNQFVFAVVRGDTELNETKLANAVHAQSLRPATEDEIRAVGAVPGYASPVGLANVLVVADEWVTTSPNLVAGANEAGYHLLNVNYGRDYTAQIVTDLVAAREGDACPDCGQPLRAARGVEVGNIFQLGTRYTAALGATFSAADGTDQPVVMGSYGIGITRLLACIAESHRDEHGLVWPVSVAPYPVHVVVLTGKTGGGESLAVAEQVVADLAAAGLEPLFDDRDETPGVKFNDADLIGLPLRLTVSERSLKAGGVELKRRDAAEKEIVPLAEVVARVERELAQMEAEIGKTVVEIAYR